MRRSQNFSDKTFQENAQSAGRPAQKSAAESIAHVCRALVIVVIIFLSFDVVDLEKLQRSSNMLHTL